MAEILLTPIINKSVEITGNVLFEQGRRLYWLKEDIAWLQREMGIIRSYIDDAKAKAIGRDSGDPKVIKELLKIIQQLANDVEDLLDEFLPKLQHTNKYKGATCCLKMAYFANEFAVEIKKIKKRVAEIDRRRTTYNITNTNNNNNDCIPLVNRRRSFLHADETEVIGLDDDFNKLQAKLLDQELHFGVVSIVGMPGLGKTTLAKKLYRHVRDQFECSGLIYVSQQPQADVILLDIAKQLGLTEEQTENNFQDNLLSLLKTKRYVILLDDIWDTKFLDYLENFLPKCDSKIGSRIIITSRNSDVGRYIGGSSSLHELKPLDPEKSFELFTKKIFNFDNNNWVNASPNLENIGRSIVERCGGIPLAIVVAAGMLRARERTEHVWNRVLKRMGLAIEDECANVLALSYNDLPIALRPCFLYFGLFPEDYEIRTFNLTNMWIAEKLIVVNGGNRREAEDLAEDYLNDLVSRNLIQVAKRTYGGRISSCRIHDLLHSLCVGLGKESNFFHTEHNVFGDHNNVSRLRRITFYSDKVINEIFCSNPKPKKLRAIFCFSEDPFIFYRMANFDFKLLQVLAVFCPAGRYPHQDTIHKIGNMSTLRYLRVEGGIKLPNSISKLKYLETLHIGRNSQFESNGCFSVNPFCPNNMNSLPNNLQTLMWIHDKDIQPRLLDRLINLRKLGIREVSDSTIRILSLWSPVPTTLPNTLEVLKLHFDRENTWMQINLSSYQNMVKLHLRWLETMPNNSVAFPPNLVKLTLVGCRVDSQLLATLQNLRILKMRTCMHNEVKMDLSCNAQGRIQNFRLGGSKGH